MVASGSASWANVEAIGRALARSMRRLVVRFVIHLSLANSGRREKVQFDQVLVVPETQDVP